MTNIHQTTDAAWVTHVARPLIALPRAVADLKLLPVVLHFKPAPRHSLVHSPFHPALSFLRASTATGTPKQRRAKSTETERPCPIHP